MKRHRHTPEQIVRKLREGERLLNEGKDITEVVRHLEIAEVGRGAARMPAKTTYFTPKARTGMVFRSVAD